jgi:ABC-type lipoprotein release transport system permease subunit
MAVANSSKGESCARAAALRMMNTFDLIKKSLTYFWRTNLAVVFGVAVAVSVLTGALLVGDSVRASLKNILLEKIGSTSFVVSSQNFFREDLTTDIQKDERFQKDFKTIAPMVIIEGAIVNEESGLRSAGVSIYGVDERFWQFHGKDFQPPKENEVLLSESLTQELNVKANEELSLRIEKFSDIPVESLHGRKEDLGINIRVNFHAAVPTESLGEFSLRPSQESVHAVFVSLRTLQKEMKQENKINTILVSEKQGSHHILNDVVKEKATLEDLGIKLLALDNQLSLETNSALINDYLYEKTKSSADKLGLKTIPVFSYLANSIGANGKEIPYSLVTAVDETTFSQIQNSRFKIQDYDSQESKIENRKSKVVNSSQSAVGNRQSAILLNEWAAKELNAKARDTVYLVYYLWQENGKLITKSAEFTVAGIIPIKGFAADRNLVPEYPGITEAKTIGDWDPPFPIDLSKIRKQDEDYWKQYRTTPKAFITLSKGQELWQSRFGKLTSIRIAAESVPPAPTGGSSSNTRSLPQAVLTSELKSSIVPSGLGLSVISVKSQGLESARGTTDFGQYFLYFSFFLVVSALLLASLFFRFGIEQRQREIGLLQSIGFSAAKIRNIFLTEGFILSLVGSLLGTIGAVLYGKLIMYGLQTWWLGVVGTTKLELYINPTTLLIGFISGIIASLVCIVLTLRGLARRTTRSLLTGVQSSRFSVQGRSSLKAMFITFLLIGIILLLLSILKFIGQEAGFFGGGILILISLLCLQSVWLKRRTHKLINGNGAFAISQLGFRNATHKPGRSILCITLIAAAVFIVVTVDAFRKDDSSATFDKRSGNGGFPLFAESQLPLIYDPNTNEGKEELLLTPDDGSQILNEIKFSRFRVRPGDDASCLNLFQARNPRIIAPTDDFVKENRFVFQSYDPPVGAGGTDPSQNPWPLLDKEQTDGSIPVIADANSLTYALHLRVGDIFTLQQETKEPIRLRIVGALSNSIFQGEFLMSEKNFLKLFPEQQGFKFFLIDVPPDKANEAAEVLEEKLADFNFDVQATNELLAEFHRVENTYLSTFQMLGALGLALGTLGLAAVLLRNALERRRELALLKAIGYDESHFSLMALAENAFLLFSGLVIGAVCALLAIAPVVISRGGKFPFVSIGALLLIVIVCGLGASVLATMATLRSPLLQSLRSE